ncbi:MAG: CRTAC1 family protein [Acidobacteriaceae bacterium]|nr:CRTAC1 family protein [Acidobacteriaceae bacterium]
MFVQLNLRVVILACVVIASVVFAGVHEGSKLEFANVAEKAGLSFVLENSPTARKFMIETMPGGIAVFDYNGDGRPDIYFTNGAEVPSLGKNAPKFWNRLYRNDGNLHFTDVTEQAGVAGKDYAMGVAAADYDNDGHPDLFVAGVDHNLLLHNRGNGTFEDVTEKAGIASGQWAVAAGWFDYDNDGKLDLIVIHYSKTPMQDRYCGDRDRNIRIYCHPKYFEPLPATLYRNLGSGKFEDVTQKSGLAQYAGRGMSVAFADYDGDGYMDVFVTNDNMPNFLFHNRRNGTFEEVGLLSGVALPDRGQPVSSMGVDFRDYDNDGLPDIAFTALAGETYPLFQNIGHDTFTDATYTSRIGPLSTNHSGWGIGLIDFNNDGWKDYFAANSHVNDRIEAFESHVYKEANNVFLNTGGKFSDATPAAMKAAMSAHRGAAFGDFDGDGKVDVVVSSLGAPSELWHNTTTESGNWVEFRLQGVRSNRDGIGAVIRVGKQWNEMTSAVSYASASLGPVHFGLGAVSEVNDMEIRWPSGRIQKLQHLPVNRVIDIKEPEQ